MAIKWATYLHRTKKFGDTILLAGVNRIIDDADRERGYFRKEDILQMYGHKVNAKDIKRSAFLVEWQYTDDGSAQPIETARIDVR